MLSIVAALMLSAAPATTDTNTNLTPAQTEAICKVAAMNRFAECLSDVEPVMQLGQEYWEKEANICEDTRIREESACHTNPTK